jgi:hypothetical protein
MTYAEIHIANKLDLLKDNISRQPVVFQWLQIVRLNPVHGEMYSIQHYAITFVCDL